MKLPGTNTITLTEEAIILMFQRHLACDLDTGIAKARVTSMSRNAYGEITFTVTTDAEITPPTTKEHE